jgi:hypothetical protein
MFTYFYRYIPIPVYIHLRPCFILKRPYTPYTCLHTSTIIYLFNFPNFHGDIYTYIDILQLPYTYTCLRTSTPIYYYMFNYFYYLYLSLKPYTLYTFLNISTFTYATCSYFDAHVSILIYISLRPYA